MLRPASAAQIRRLVDDYYVSLFRYAFHLSGTRADAEDLTQEAFCQAQKCWQQLRDPKQARNWLFAILRNQYLRERRDAQSARHVGLSSMPSVVAPIDVAPDADEVNLLHKALADLPETYRTPIILYYFDDFTYRDIADQMGVPIGTIMSRLARGKAFLRQRLAPAEEAAR